MKPVGTTNGSSGGLEPLPGAALWAEASLGAAPWTEVSPGAGLQLVEPAFVCCSISARNRCQLLSVVIGVKLPGISLLVPGRRHSLWSIDSRRTMLCAGPLRYRATSTAV